MIRPRLAKCPRCERLFTRIQSGVCPVCQSDEDIDFKRIGEVLIRQPGLNVEQLAEVAGVTLQCVLRMLREGRLENEAVTDGVKCGRCGAPAISVTKRLCEHCLVILDQECAGAIREMRAKLVKKAPTSEVHEVRRAVDTKRGEGARQHLPSAQRRRMVYQERRADAKKRGK